MPQSSCKSATLLSNLVFTIDGASFVVAMLKHWRYLTVKVSLTVRGCSRTGASGSCRKNLFCYADFDFERETFVPECVRVCVCASLRMHVCVRMYGCVRACVCVRMYVCVREVCVNIGGWEIVAGLFHQILQKPRFEESSLEATELTCNFNRRWLAWRGSGGDVTSTFDLEMYF